jgi:hypothetical protein
MCKATSDVRTYKALHSSDKPSLLNSDEKVEPKIDKE